MDPTLTAILRTLFEYSQTIDALRVQMAQVGQERDAARQAAEALLAERGGGGHRPTAEPD